MRVMLVTPDYHCGVVESAGKWPPLGLVYLAGHLREAGHEVKIYDAMSKNHSHQQVLDCILAWKPDVVGAGAFTATMPVVMQLMEQIKQLNIDVITVVGGIHPTFCPEQVLDRCRAIDYVIRYEGEITFPDLLYTLEQDLDLAKVQGIAFRAKDSRVVITEERAYIADLDTVIPAWDLLDWSDYTFYIYPGSRLAVVSTARGCIHECSFCSQQKFWQQQWRARKPETVVAEIEYLTHKYGMQIFFIADEFPTRDRERWEAILDLLIQRKLGVKLLMETRVDDIIRDADIMYKYAEAGVIHIYVGIEATSNSRLELFKKGIVADDAKKALDLIHQANIVSETSFVLGTPDEVVETIEATLALAQAYNPDFAHFLFLTPWPYADIYSELKSNIEVVDYSKYNLVEPIIKPTAMTRDQLFDQILRCYKNFYFAKLPQWVGLGDSFKRRYAIQSMKAIMENSFLKEHVLKMGTMPVAVEKVLQKILAE